MADKKITDLGLRDEVTSDLNLPSDDGIQSYRVTAAQIKNFILANQNILLAMLKDDIFNGLTGVTPAADDYFPLIDTSDSNKTKKGLVGTFASNAYRSATTTDSILTSDRTIKCSGASFVITLPANGTAGKRYTVIHGGANDLSQKYTVNTTGGATIFGPKGALASGVIKLCTRGEIFTFEDDGTNWLIVDHKCDTPWISFTPTLTGFGTPTVLSAFWKRSGNEMRIEARWWNGTVSATPARFGMPSNAAVDTAQHTDVSSAMVGQWFGAIQTTAFSIPDGSDGPWVVSVDATTSSLPLAGNLLGVAATGKMWDTAENCSAYCTTNNGSCIKVWGVAIDDWQP